MACRFKKGDKVYHFADRETVLEIIDVEDNSVTIPYVGSISNCQYKVRLLTGETKPGYILEDKLEYCKV